MKYEEVKIDVTTIRLCCAKAAYKWIDAHRKDEVPAEGGAHLDCPECGQGYSYEPRLLAYILDKPTSADALLGALIAARKQRNASDT